MDPQRCFIALTEDAYTAKKPSLMVMIPKTAVIPTSMQTILYAKSIKNNQK